MSENLENKQEDNINIEGQDTPVSVPSFSLNTAILKPVAIMLFVTTLVGSFYLVSDLDSENKYLAVFGVAENSQKKFNRLDSQQKKLTAENNKLKSSNKDLKNRLDSKDFFTQQRSVDLIKGDVLNWVDRKDPEGDLVYGMINSLDRVATYFNSLRYQHPILYAGNRVEVSKLNIDRKGASFNVVISNIFGKAFFLSTELVEIINSFPVYKGGEVRDFSKKINKEGYYEMQFALKLNIQHPSEKDPDDYRFQEYLNWLSGETSSSTSSSSSTRSTGIAK